MSLEIKVSHRLCWQFSSQLQKMNKNIDTIQQLQIEINALRKEGPLYLGKMMDNERLLLFQNLVTK